MATFSAQIQDLVGSFSDEAALDSFITEGANEVINAMPRSVMERVADEVSVTDGSTSSETHKILHVLRDDQPCRLVLARDRGRIQDSSDMHFATASDPAYYIQDGKINVFPNSGTVKMVGVPVYNQGSPLNADNISTITNFPDEYEYLITLYAAIKALQQLMNNKHGNTDITGAITALEASVVNAEDEIEDAGKMVANIVLGVAEVLESAGDTDSTSSGFKTAADAITNKLGRINTHSFDNEETFKTTNSQITRVKDALDKVSLLIESNKPASSYDAHDLLQAEDTELLQGNLSIVNAEIQRAQTHLTEWNSILQGALAEAQGFANEVQARGTWTSAKAQVWNGYFASAGAYAQAAQTYLASAQGYASEVQARLQVDSTEYGWYQSQQAKLQADYDRGIQIMRGG
tara:strand:- start:1323 stop:2537 length:1215 start_codon:yes stop_codon:yes gene_type:complete